MNQFCKRCGAQIRAGAGFCPSCGPGPQTQGRQDSAALAGGAQPVTAAGTIPGPWGFIKTSLRTSLNSLRRQRKNPKRLIPIFALSGLWLVLSILPALGINPLSVRILSFFTFAQGGLYGGVPGAVGGVVGKAVFAYCFSVLLLPLFSGKGSPFKGAGGGFMRFISGLAVQSAQAVGQLALGLGLALIVFNFFTGNASCVNSMAGVVGFVLARRALLRREGFFWGLLLSITNKRSGGRTPSHMAACRVMSGYAAGSAAGIALSALRLPYLPYALGAALLVAGMLLSLAEKPKREVGTR